MKRSGMMWIRDEDEFIGKFFEPTGDRFEIEHLDTALSYVAARRCALDVGAHYGSWTRHLARSFDRVMAFEPVPQTFDCLRRNVGDFANVDVHNAAIGQVPGFVSVSVGKMYAHPGMETVIGGGDTIMLRIDDLGLRHLDFLKVDVEGYELFVLKGAEQMLIEHKPVILLEENIRGPLEHNVQNGECEKYLRSLGARRVATVNKDLIFAWPTP